MIQCHRVLQISFYLEAQRTNVVHILLWMSIATYRQWQITYEWHTVDTDDDWGLIHGSTLSVWMAMGSSLRNTYIYCTLDFHLVVWITSSRSALQLYAVKVMKPKWSGLFCSTHPYSHSRKGREGVTEWEEVNHTFQCWFELKTLFSLHCFMLYNASLSFIVEQHTL